MADTLPIVEEVRAINVAFPFPEPIQRWKARGGRVIGWGCTYVPEEIICAGGMLPVRVTGDAREVKTDEADAYLHVSACSYTRTVLQLVLEGEYDFLDGYVTTASCDSTRRLFDNWVHYLDKPSFRHILSLPRKAVPWSEQLFYEELQELRQKLETSFAISIGDDALRQAIQLHNHTRRLLKQLHELRKGSSPPLTGSECFEVINAGLRMPRDEFNQLLGRLLDQASSSTPDNARKPRLMLSGSNLANPDFVAGIESQGAVVVVDDLCTGARYWSDLVDEDPNLDPMRALAHRYLNNIPCARTTGMSRIRHDRVLELAQEYKVHGMVSAVIRNCMHNGMDRPQMREKFERAGIPVLELDTEYGSGRTGMVATRVQAFLEMLAAQAVA